MGGLAGPREGVRSERRLDPVVHGVEIDAYEVKRAAVEADEQGGARTRCVTSLRG